MNKVTFRKPASKPINRQKLNARFHQLVGHYKLDADEKRLIVRQASNNKCESSADLTDSQLREAVKLLEGRQNDSIKRMRAKAINLARDLNLVTGEAPNIDWTGLNNFTQKSFKQPFYELSYQRLIDCITALEKWQNYNQNKALKNLI